MTDATNPQRAAGPPHVVEVAGTSMEPRLPRGARVVVRPFSGELVTGDVVLFRTPSGLLLHRLVGIGTCHGQRQLFHCGDGARAIGVTSADAAVAVAVAVLHPPGIVVPRPQDLDAPGRRRFRHAQRRVRVILFADRVAARIGWLRRPLRGAGLGFRRLILGA